MGWHIVVTFIDAANHEVAREETTDPRGGNWKVPLKKALMETEAKHVTLEWARVAIVVERT